MHAKKICNLLFHIYIKNTAFYLACKISTFVHVQLFILAYTQWINTGSLISIEQQTKTVSLERIKAAHRATACGGTPIVLHYTVDA